MSSYNEDTVSVSRCGDTEAASSASANRTLRHPSFMSLYMAALPNADCSSQTVHPIIPAEVFYTDPTMSCESRIPGRVSEMRVFDCFQLNTPPPVMSTFPAPPTRPDPFRSGPHPIRDLGSLTLTINTPHPPVQPSCVILQLTQEEDQAITNLLKLHHQQPIRRDETLTGPQIDFFSGPMESTSADEAYNPFCSDVQHPREAGLQGQLQQGKPWSDMELEAANTLLSLFSMMDRGKIWGQNHNMSAATLPDPLPCQGPGSETLTASITDWTQNDIGYASFSRAREHEDPGCREGRSADDVHLPVCEECLASSLPPRLPSPSSKSDSSICGGFSEVTEQALSEFEGDAAHVLLSLRDKGALEIMH